MATSAMIAVEDVLAIPARKGSFGAAQPNMAGLKLLASLKTQYKIALVTAEEDKAPVEDWLKAQAIEYVYLVPRRPIERDLSLRALREVQINFLRALGLALELVVDANPQVIASALQKGVIGLLVAHPAYMRPEWRADTLKQPRPWDEVEAEINHQRELRAKDERVTVL